MLFANIGKAYGIPQIMQNFPLILACLFFIMISFPFISRVKTINRSLSYLFEQLYQKASLYLTIFSIALFTYFYITYYTTFGRQLILLPRGNIDPIVSLAWFITELGIGISFIGLIIMFHKKPHIKRYLFLIFVAPYFLFYLYTLANNPAFPWAMRRLITVVIPSLMIFIGCAIDYFTRHNINKSNPSIIHKYVIIILFLFLLIPSISMDRTLVEPQFNKFIPQVGKIADFFGDNDIILDANRYTDATISLPLKYIYDKNSIYLWNKE